MNKRAGTLENKWLMTLHKIYILQGINNYYTLWTLQGWSYCRVLLQKWWETSKSKSYHKCKIL